MYESIKYVYGGKFISRGKWQHPHRTINSTELILVTKGEFEMFSGEKNFSLTQGAVLRIDEGSPHGGSETEGEDISFYWLHFVGAEKDELPPEFFYPDNFAQVELLTRQLLHYSRSGEYPKESADCLMRLLIMELSAQYRRANEQENNTVSTVKEWIRLNSDLPLKVSDVAEHFNYNGDYLNRIFKKFYPSGLKNYISDMRLQKIKQALTQNELSMYEIASKYGFSDYKYFLKFFKYHEGISPSEFKELYYNIHTNNK